MEHSARFLHSFLGATLTIKGAVQEIQLTLHEFFSIGVAAHLVLWEHAEGLHEGRLEVCQHGRPTPPNHNTPSPPPQRQSFEKLQTHPKIILQVNKNRKGTLVRQVEARNLPTHLFERQKVDSKSGWFIYLSNRGLKSCTSHEIHLEQSQLVFA